MKLQFSQNPGLPPLAGLTTVSVTDHLTTVVHGRWLESQEGGLVEGVGEGEPEEFGLCSSAHMFGSVVVLQQDGIPFVYSASTQTGADEVVVANALPPLLSAIGDKLDSTCGEYAALNSSIMSGIFSYVRQISTDGGFVNWLMHANLQVTVGGATQVVKPSPAHFPDYCRHVAPPSPVTSA